MTPSNGTPSPTFPRAALLLLKGLDNRWQRYQDCFKLCQQEFSKEAVHDLRVATRRLLILLEILETLFLGMKGRKLRRELKRQLDSLDELMDIQVQIAYVVDEMAGVEGISAFLKYLYRREAYLLKDVEHIVKSISIADQNRRMANFRLVAESKLQIREVRSRLIAAVDISYSNVLHRYSKINPEETESIHRTRIAFKSFRYAVEIIHPLLIRYPVGLLKAMNEFQGLMGDIQDNEVLQEMFEVFGKKHPDVNISPSKEFVKERHQLLVTTFVSEMETVHTFWRISPRQPYPWNKIKPESETIPS
ncbi:MAG: CHAD domain-containing protein [Anaerolineales bacterium]